VLISNYDPILGKNVTIRAVMPYTNKELNRNKMLSSFIPGFIHSIDAGVIRLLIWFVYRKCDYIIVTCHDSLQYNPELEDVILDVISNLYNNDIPLGFAGDLFYNPSTSNIPDLESISPFLGIYNNSLGSLNRSDLAVTGNIMYPLEGN